MTDEWSVLRGGVAAVLAQCGVQSPVQVGTGTEAVAAIERANYELVVLGVVPDLSQSVALGRLRAVRPEVRVMVLLDVAERNATIEILDAGANAVLSRNLTEVDLREATQRIGQGQRYVSPALLAEAFGSNPGRARERDAFTDRERDVLRLLAEGRSNREIADALFIGEATVKTHLRKVYEKLKVANRVQAVSRAMELDLLG